MPRGVKAGCKREEGLLTEEVVEGLRPRSGRWWFWDSKYPGFAVRVHPSGVRTFYLIRKHDGKTEHLSLGSWPAVKCDKARKQAEAKGGKYGEGGSPVQAKRAAKAKARAQVKLSEAWERYQAARLAHADDRRKRAVRFEVWTWGKHLEETFGSRAVDSLTRAEVARWFLGLTAKAGPVGANRARALLSGILSFWAGQVEADLPNPCRGVKPNRETGRERYLSAGELRAWWAAVLAAPAQDTRELLAVLSLTAARQGTLRAMCWEELGWQGKAWRIPGEKMKAGRECVLPLNAPALGVLRARWERTGKPRSGYVFPSRDGQPRRELREPFTDTATSAGLADFTPHDCRRTAATAAADAGVDSAVIAHLLGHVDKSVLGRYRKVTPATAAAASEKMAAALLLPAGLVPADFVAGLPKSGAMRPEAEAAGVLPFPGVTGGGQ
ncbi:MAG: integrase family protein [Thermoanaerobaculaceae bacterium]|nr:integrase family protein [Thermoanaerobaculaceae bacterium]